MKHVEALVQRPRRLGRPQRGPLVRLRGRGLPLHGKPCQRGRPHAAASGMRSVVLIPSDLEQGKVAGTVVLGGDVMAVDGSYDDVNRLCAELSESRPWASSNSTCVPITRKAQVPRLRDAEQLGWRPLDAVVVPLRPVRCSRR
jgi:hypothetical protein